MLWIKIRTGPKENPVWVGTCSYGTVVSVAKGEGFGKGELERDVLTLVMAHRYGGLELWPEAKLSLIPCGLGVTKAMRSVGHAERAGGTRVQPKRWDLSFAVRLSQMGLPPASGTG